MAYKRLKSGKSISSEQASKLSLYAKEQIFESVRNQFLETMKLPKEYDEIAEEININGYIILRTGHDLNEYYEAVSGKDSFDNEKAEIGFILKTIYEKSEPIIRKRGILYLCRLPSENIYTNIDKEKFCYAVLDVLLNSAENTPEGGRIRIGVKKTQKYVKIIIGDSGCGMNPETAEHCTEPFYSTAPDKKMGLGLTLVHHFTCKSGGRMNIKSEKGKGTTIEMLLPIITGSGNELSVETTVPDILGSKLSPVDIVLASLKK